MQGEKTRSYNIQEKGAGPKRFRPKTAEGSERGKKARLKGERHGIQRKVRRTVGESEKFLF